MNTFKQNIINTLKAFMAVSLTASMTMTHADDTEVFYSVNVANNLLFVLDVSGSMNEKIVSVTTTTNEGSETISNEGELKQIDKGVGWYGNDAIQNDTVTTTAGSQWVKDDVLDFKPSRAVGVRFLSLDGIPSNATITYADITFRSKGSHSQNTNINISIENSDWANDYSWAPSILGRHYLGSVPWSITNNWNGSSTPETPDLSSLVQQVIDYHGANWGGVKWGSFTNSFAFKFTTISGDREVRSSDVVKQGRRPALYIEYNVNGGATQTFYTKAWNNYIYRDTYDAEQEITTTEDQVNGDNTLTFDNTQDVGLRFLLKSNASTKITKDSIIKSAYITLTASESDSESTEIEISVENTGYSRAYTDLWPKIKERSYINRVNWSPGAWSAGNQYQTEELKELVQYAVNRDDWDNAIAFLFHPVNGKRVAFANDYSSGAAQAVLHIEYFDIGSVTPGTVTTPTTTIVTRVETRLKFMQEALEEVLTDPETPNLNVGLMKYAGMYRDPDSSGFGSSDNVRKHYTGGIVFPVKPIYETVTNIVSATTGDNLPDPAAGITVGQYIPQIANEWSPTGGTPIVDALYEAALYFRGEKMHYGKERNTNQDIASSGSHPSSYFDGVAISKTVASDGRSSMGNSRRYISPIKSECQSNFLVLMSDGKPTYYHNNGTDDNQGPFARALVGTGGGNELKNKIGSCIAGNAETGNTGTNLTAGTCGREITQYLATHDQMPTSGRGKNEGVEKKQWVKTFTIGFGSGLEDGAKEYLESLTTVDGQGFYPAEDKAQLKQAFKQIIAAIAEPSGSLASPGYSVNVKSGLEHEKDIYIPVFTRKNSSRWAGNLKKFRIADVNGKRSIQSRTGNYAVDEWGGFNDDEATGAIDYWSKTTDAVPDGVDVEKGGLANLLVAADRKLYSNLDCASATNGCALNTANNKLDVDNAKDSGKIKNSDLNITNNLISYLGVNDAEEARIKLINFIRGWKGGDYDDDATPKGIERKHMGDMLHSEPLVITYNKGTANGSGKKQYIFAATNEGFLHAFNPAHDKAVDADAGKEMFAFMPKELLKNIKPQLKNKGVAEDHKYGIDGILSYWHDDKNNDGNVNGADTVYLYFGMRRGGNSFYALDVTSIDNPKLLWMKTKKSGSLSHMGQSWSAPYIAKIGIDGGTAKEVVIVSGGYDPDEDRDIAGTKKVNNASSTVVADEGNDIFIFDAKEGTLLWSLRNSMNDTTSIVNSIPGGLKIMDVNKNGLLDRLYFGDTGGNVWRLDLSEKISSGTDTTSKLTKFASLGVDAARKFFNEPDVGIIKTNGKTMFTVSIGSGFRAHPKDRSISDKFFVLKDTSPYYPLADDYSPIVMDKLASVSITGTEGTLTTAGSLAVSRSGFDDADKDKGWYVSFAEGKGEKVLATSVTYDGIITFTSLLPEILTSGINIDPCRAPVTSGRHYALDILTGKAVVNFDESNETNVEESYDVFQTVSKGEIPGKPQIVFNAVTQTNNENDDGAVTSQVCLHPVDIRIGKKRSQSSGYDACRLESVYWNDPEEK